MNIREKMVLFVFSRPNSVKIKNATVRTTNFALSNQGAVWLPVNQIYQTLYEKLSTQKDEHN